MARKRGLFFHSIFTFLSRCQLTIRRQWLRHFPKGYRLPLALYGGLAIITLMCATMMPGFSSDGRVLHTSGDAIAQPAEHTMLEQSEAQRLEQLARDYYNSGQLDVAADTFEQAAARFQQLGYLEQTAESLVNQAKALQGLGLYNQAIVVLQQVLNPQNSDKPLQKRLDEITPSQITVVALRNLGDALQVVGDLEQSQLFLEHSRGLAEKLSLTSEIGPTYLSLGNLARTQSIANLRLNNLTIEEAIDQLQKRQSLSPIQYELRQRWIDAAEAFEMHTDKALAYYQQAVNNSSSPLTQAQAQLNALSLYLDRKQRAKATAAIPTIYPLLNGLNELPPSRAIISAHINLAHSLMRMANSSDPSVDAPLLQKAEQLLKTARQQASQLGAAQIESYALGSLGELYKHMKQWPQAKTFTQDALKKVNAVSTTNLPLNISDIDLAYRWYHHLGEILKEQNDSEEEAIAAYEMSVKLLQKRLRLDVASGNLNSQFSFTTEIEEPVYKDFMDLLLQPQVPSQKNLQRVREVSSLLLEAELTGFLQEPCTIATPEQVDTLIQDKDQRAAIIYPISLSDRLEVIVKLPGDQDLLHYNKPIPEKQLLVELKKLQLALEEDYSFEAVRTLSQKFYTWIIEPAQKSLNSNQVDTLVFTLDRKLQTIPMAALYDGEAEAYLIEKYAIAEFLGLSVEGATTPLEPNDLNIIAAGLSSVPNSLPEEFKNDFLPLRYIEQELEEISKLENKGIDVVTLSDETFTLKNFNTRLNEDKFPVVHLATHGQFSVNPKRTFLLTGGESNDALVKVNQLAVLFRVRGLIRLDSIDLLVLNACETASGDDFATLGIAGTAVRAGARSAIASLWTLNDKSSVYFTEILYENLRQPNISKAEALRQAQLALLQKPQYKHPRYWSSYILAGNWLPLTSTSRSTGSAI